MTPKFPPPSADDRDWLDEIADVRPLDDRHARARMAPSRAPRKAQPPAETFTRPHLRQTPLAILSRDADCLSGLADNLDAKLLKDLARGAHPPTAMLDLHGHREGNAWLKLMNWLDAAADNDHRCVLVITGKGRGYGPAADMGLLKAQTPQWLASHPKVMAFHTALPRDGGTGAVYVYLKRRC
jgi:DNA-nicking Smr family endonuclease